MTLVLGVDSSTSSCTVELRRAEDGELLASGRAQHPASHPPRSEQDPAAWLTALGQACEQALRGGLAPEAIAVAGQQHGLVVVDGRGEPLRQAKLWNDTESAPQARRLAEQLAPEEWVRRCGSVPAPSFTVTKLAWLAENEPATLDAAGGVRLPHDHLTWALTGRSATDRGDASGTGYFDPVTSRWDVALLELAAGRRNWSDLLPEVLGPDEAAGEVTRDAAAAFGLQPGAKVAAGTGDNMAAALGLGVQPGDLVLSLGTSATAYTVSEQQSSDPSGHVCGFADATGRFLPLACTMNATKVTDAVMRLLGADHAGMDALALGAPADSAGPVLVPWFDGERTPDRPGASGVLSALRPDVTREQLARAAVEGVLLNLLDAAHPLLARGEGVSGRLLLTGGGSRSAAARQLLADLTGREVVTLLDSDEAVARGACLQAAAVATGATVADVVRQLAPQPAAVIVPRRAHRAAADERRQRYAEHRDALL